MNVLPLLTVALLVLFPYALPSDVRPNGSLRMGIARWAEKKGKELRRVVRQLDNSQTKLEPNEPYVVHRRNSPLSRDLISSDTVWNQTFTEPDYYALNHMFTKKLTTTWNWSRKHNMDYVLNVSAPAYVKVSDDLIIRVEGKDYWEFKTPLPWDEADATCRAAGLKLAQPKTSVEVKKLQEALHIRIHNRPKDCHNETWSKKNGYCLLFVKGFVERDAAAKLCKSLNSTLPYPSLGNVTVWQKTVKEIGGGSTAHAGAYKAIDGQWLWIEDNSTVQEKAWTPGKPNENGDCSVVYPTSGALIDKGCYTTWHTLCQGKSSTHWLGALGSDDAKCVKWVNGKCIEEEDHEAETHIADLWQEGLPGDLISSDDDSEYALLLQIEHDHPFSLMKTTEMRPFLCEAACPLGFVNLGARCLLVQKVWLSWHGAQAACVKIGLQLFETEEETHLHNFLISHRLSDTYWIGGTEGRVIGKTVDMSIIKKLPYICELAHGTRKMNVTDPLSYTDQKKIKLPKVETQSTNCTVIVTERTIRETYPFSVQRDITGFLWVEYYSPTDEHGSNNCDNNNDWVSGEWCYAHSKWGYSTSYLQDGDQIMAQGDYARLTLNGTVTYIYNEHEVNIEKCEDDPDSDRSRRSIRGAKLRRSKRSSKESPKKNLKNHKAKFIDVTDDNNKPLMSYIGKRAGDWVRTQAQERKAHLVAYTIDQLSPTVTDMKVEQEFSELMAPGSIFEEEFENIGTESVITTFSKTKNIANSYRWSVNKGLSIEDSHISSYSMANTQSESNTFSLSNNIAQTDGTSKSINQGRTDSSKSSKGNTESEATGTSIDQSILTSEKISKGGESSNIETKIDGVERSEGSSVSSGGEQTTGGEKISSETDTSSSTTAKKESVSHETSTSEAQSSKKAKTDTNIQSSTQSVGESQSSKVGKSSSTTDRSSSSDSTVTEKSSSGGGGFSFWGFSAKAEFSKKERTQRESTRTNEKSSTTSSERASSKSTTSAKTNTQGSSTTSETGQTSKKTETAGQTNSNENTVGQAKSQSNTESISHTKTESTGNISSQGSSSSTKIGNTVTNSQNVENTHGTDIKSNKGSSTNQETSRSSEITYGSEDIYELENAVNQETSKSSESSRGSDKNRELQHSQETQKSNTHTVNIDKNEEVETSEEETLETQNEVTIPPKTNVKIEWRVEQRRVRLPWKASIYLTGWINIRFKNDEEICDMYHAGSGWNYNYTSSCEKDNRLYGYPLSYLKDKDFIQQGEGLRFTASGVFEAVLATSHFLRVTETALGPDYDDGYTNNNEDYYDDQPIASRRRKRDLRRLPSKVTDYHLEFDDHGNGRANIENDNRYFKRFRATKKFKRMN